MDKKVISCEFNIDTACVEAKYADGSMISIDCTLVEAEVARNMYESSELEWLVYHAPVDYVNLLLHGDVREYLKNVTECHPFENYLQGHCRTGSALFSTIGYSCFGRPGCDHPDRRTASVSFYSFSLFCRFNWIIPSGFIPGGDGLNLPSFFCNGYSSI